MSMDDEKVCKQVATGEAFCRERLEISWAEQCTVWRGVVCGVVWCGGFFLIIFVDRTYLLGA